MRSLLRGAVPLLVVGVLTGCGDRSETEASADFVTAFNEGSLSEERDLFHPKLSDHQLTALNDLGKKCSLDQDSLATVDSFVSPARKILGVVAECEGKRYSIITGVAMDCSNAAGECDDNYRIDPVGLPGNEGSGSISNTSLPSSIRDLEPLAPAANTSS